MYFCLSPLFFLLLKFRRWVTWLVILLEFVSSSGRRRKVFLYFFKTNFKISQKCCTNYVLSRIFSLCDLWSSEKSDHNHSRCCHRHNSCAFSRLTATYQNTEKFTSRRSLTNSRDNRVVYSKEKNANHNIWCFSGLWNIINSLRWIVWYSWYWNPIFTWYWEI